jgi:hypothetical protein
MWKLVVLYAMASSLLWCGKYATALFHITTVLGKKRIGIFLSLLRLSEKVKCLTLEITSVEEIQFLFPYW